MSHGKLRHDKNCLNCGSIVKGPYCQICGQHNVEPQESVWDLVSHFVYDITHFDGKFFQAIKLLLFKPGFLSREYVRGRKASYINPIRFYVFTSAIFFLIFFSASKPDDVINFGVAVNQATEQKIELTKKLSQTKDSLTHAKIASEIHKYDSLIVLYEAVGLTKKSALVNDSVRQQLLPLVEKNSKLFDFSEFEANTLEEYDSIQQALPKAQRDGWLERYAERKVILLNQKYHGRAEEFRERFSEVFLHSIPKMMFVSLPLIAFFLWLLYSKKKKYFYANHAILVIHDYIAIYLIILITYLFRWFKTLTHWNIFGWMSAILVLSCFYYVYKSMRNFYDESRGKTVLKFSIFSLLALISFVVLGVIFVVNTMINV